MGMTLKELLTKGEGTLSAQEAKALAAQCRMDVDTTRRRFASLRLRRAFRPSRRIFSSS